MNTVMFSCTPAAKGAICSVNFSAFTSNMVRQRAFLTE